MSDESVTEGHHRRVTIYSTDVSSSSEDILILRYTIIIGSAQLSSLTQALKLELKLTLNDELG